MSMSETHTHTHRHTRSYHICSRNINHSGPNTTCSIYRLCARESAISLMSRRRRRNGTSVGSLAEAGYARTNGKKTESQSRSHVYRTKRDASWFSPFRVVMGCDHYVQVSIASRCVWNRDVQWKNDWRALCWPGTRTFFFRHDFPRS